MMGLSGMDRRGTERIGTDCRGIGRGGLAATSVMRVVRDLVESRDWAVQGHQGGISGSLSLKELSNNKGPQFFKTSRLIRGGAADSVQIDRNRGEDGVGEEAFLVSLVVEFLKCFAGDFDAFGEGGFWVEFDSGEDGFPIGVLFEEADGVVGVGFEGEVLERAEGEEGEHVATGEGGDKGLLGVGEFGGAEVFGGGGGADRDAVAKIEVVVAGVFFVGKRFPLAVPGEVDSMVRHEAVYLPSCKSAMVFWSGVFFVGSPKMQAIADEAPICEVRFED